MPVEIERKFLVVGDAWRAQARKRTRMVQGYLGGDRCSIRVRLEDARAKLNIKGKSVGAARAEFEYDIPANDADELLRDYAGDRVEKTRHYVPVDAHVFEIDEFEGDNAGLVVCEVELDDEQETFPKPPWLGPEVTHEPRYYNVQLARTPFARWADRDAVLRVIEGSVAC